MKAFGAGLDREGTGLEKRAFRFFDTWRMNLLVLELGCLEAGKYRSVYSGRISPEAYPFGSVALMLGLSRPNLLIVPQGMIVKWREEMFDKLGHQT